MPGALLGIFLTTTIVLVVTTRAEPPLNIGLGHLGISGGGYSSSSGFNSASYGAPGFGDGGFGGGSKGGDIIATPAVKGVRYAGPIVYTNEKPPVIHFPPPPKPKKGGYGKGGKGGKPKTIKYVPLPHHDLPILIYQSDINPPIHVVSPPKGAILESGPSAGYGASGGGAVSGGYSSSDSSHSSSFVSSPAESYGPPADSYGAPQSAGSIQGHSFSSSSSSASSSSIGLSESYGAPQQIQGSGPSFVHTGQLAPAHGSDDVFAESAPPLSVHSGPLTLALISPYRAVLNAFNPTQVLQWNSSQAPVPSASSVHSEARNVTAEPRLAVNGTKDRVDKFPAFVATGSLTTLRNMVTNLVTNGLNSLKETTALAHRPTFVSSGNLNIPPVIAFKAPVPLQENMLHASVIRPTFVHNGPLSADNSSPQAPLSAPKPDFAVPASSQPASPQPNYGAPASNYGVPSGGNSGFGAASGGISGFGASSGITNEYGPPSGGISGFGASSGISNEYGPPSGSFSSSLSSSSSGISSAYGVPSSPGSNYGAPSSGFVSSGGSISYGAAQGPSFKGLNFAKGESDFPSSFKGGYTTTHVYTSGKSSYGPPKKATLPHIIYTGHPPIHIFQQPPIYMSAPKSQYGPPIKSSYGSIKSSKGPPKSFKAVKTIKISYGPANGDYGFKSSGKGSSGSSGGGGWTKGWSSGSGSNFGSNLKGLKSEYHSHIKAHAGHTKSALSSIHSHIQNSISNFHSNLQSHLQNKANKYSQQQQQHGPPPQKSKPNYAIAPKAWAKPPIIIYQGVRPPVTVYEKPSGGGFTSGYSSSGFSSSGGYASASSSSNGGFATTVTETFTDGSSHSSSSPVLLGPVSTTHSVSPIALASPIPSPLVLEGPIPLDHSHVAGTDVPGNPAAQSVDITYGISRSSAERGQLVDTSKPIVAAGQTIWVPGYGVTKVISPEKLKSSEENPAALYVSDLTSAGQQFTVLRRSDNLDQSIMDEISAIKTEAKTGQEAQDSGAEVAVVVSTESQPAPSTAQSPPSVQILPAFLAGASQETLSSIPASYSSVIMPAVGSEDAAAASSLTSEDAASTDSQAQAS